MFEANTPTIGTCFFLIFYRDKEERMTLMLMNLVSRGGNPRMMGCMTQLFRDGLFKYTTWFEGHVNTTKKTGLP